jgi:hypothetical protein
MKDGMHMNRKRFHPVLLRNLAQLARDGSARSMHESIESSKLLNNSIDGIAARRRIGNITYERQNPSSALLAESQELMMLFRIASS